MTFLYCGFPAETSASSWVVGASERDLPRAASETASSDDLSSVSPGTMLYLTETDHPDHIGLFFMPDFDFLSDLDHQLRSPLLKGAQESLSSKTAVEPSLPVPVNHAKPVSSVPASSQSTVAKNISQYSVLYSPYTSYILHTSKSSPPYYQSDDLMNDLRFFFAGAPCFEENDFVARLLQSTNLESRR